MLCEGSCSTNIILENLNLRKGVREKGGQAGRGDFALLAGLLQNRRGHGWGKRHPVFGELWKMNEVEEGLTACP